MYIYNGIIFSHQKEGNQKKKEGNPAIGDNMDGIESIVLSKVSQKRER